MNVKTNFLGFDFDPSIVLASWFSWVTADWMIKVLRNWAWGVTTKSISLKARSGHRNPTVVWLWKDIWIINAVWLSWEWAYEALNTYNEYKNKEKVCPLIVSFFWSTIDEYWEISKILDESDADILEVNISCPNVEDEFWVPFACKIDSAAAVTKIVRKNTTKKIVIKLSPNVANISNIAKACEDAWANWICAINTAGPWLVIDAVARSPVLHNKVWWLSWPMIKAIALKAIWDISRAVKIPIIWTWWITTWKDAIEAIMCWATILWVWTAIYSRWEEAFWLIAKEMKEFMKSEWINSLEEIRGCIS